MRRSGYERIGKGVKHDNVINARPILNWNTAEVFLYLFQYGIPLNTAYRLGKPRVGCLICPFSSEWDDMIVSRAYPKELHPFLSRLVDWAKARDIPNIDEYIKGHKWRTRASGKYVRSPSNVTFKQEGDRLIAHVKNAQQDFLMWLRTLGTYQVTEKESRTWGELKHKDAIITFFIEYKDRSNYTVSFSGISDLAFAGLIKRVLYKSTFCIQCEACEVNCPTGALSVYPQVNVDSTKCIHCFRCLNFHNKGCMAADSLSMAETDKEKLTGISGYGTFGLRDEWLNEFAMNREDFWKSNTLGKKQVPSFKNWLKDAEIIDTKGRITPLGRLLLDEYQDMPDIVWQIIWVNLANNSSLVKWFVGNVHCNTAYSKNFLQSLYEEQYSEGYTTFRYALDALYNTLTASPIGDGFCQKERLSKDEDTRKPYNDLSDETVAYSLYKYGERHFIKSFRVEDLWNSKDTAGIFAEFCVERDAFEKALRTLDSSKTKVLVAELNMGLDNISLREDLDALSALKLMLGL